MRTVVLLAVFLPVFAAEPKLEGVWRGTLTNAPRATAKPVEVEMEFGPAPSEGACTTWKTTYREADEVRGVKDYKLCRKDDPEELFVDEGESQLRARWIGGVLISAFKLNDLLLVTHLRVRGDVLEEEIFSIEDQPPSAEQVVSLLPKSVQRLTLKRVDVNK